MGLDFISDLQGVHQHSLEWPGGANAPMHPPVTAPVRILILFFREADQGSGSISLKFIRITNIYFLDF